ncbi:transcriptional regulator [Enterobacter cloacae]|uniref:transcriptional regulator n=1 Tax=Enterobacter cloacae TaxID=550 RepID=UPI002A3F1F13|nr:winged helix-turn-helix domain-containing protein [Enterobacter cloacae]
MIYNINNLILYDSDKRSLASLCVDTPHVTLTTTSSRLLEELLRQNNEVLTRQYLLKNVWEDKGYAPSDASLNNNISFLRKQFATMSNEEINLKTIPKIGFQLVAAVSFVPESDSLDEINIVKNENLPSINKSLALKIILPLFFAVLFIIFLFTFTKNTTKFLRVEIKNFTTYHQCRVYNLHDDSNYLEEVFSVFPVLKKNCKEKPYELYYDFSSINKERSKNLLVSVCKKNKSPGIYTKCENLKLYTQ